MFVVVFELCVSRALSHSSFANFNPLTALESVIELGGLPVKRQKLVNAVKCL
ncbi:hypothetical protein J6590_041362 [Homalodisca vitripennis]|nr:hypothetical protein J6590_041362 [Homalodisca vitripennis]